MPGENYPGGVTAIHGEEVAGIRRMHSRAWESAASSPAGGWSTYPGVSRSDRTPRRAEPPAQSTGFSGYAEPRPPEDYRPGPSLGNMPFPPSPPNSPPQAPGSQGYANNNHNRSRDRQGPAGFLGNLFGQGNRRRVRVSPRNQEENYSNNQENREPQPPPEESEKSGTTLIQDILNGVGLDDDRILILGLLLILINDKADTTLIFALLYLLL